METPYGAAKAGLNALTIAFAHAYGPKVRVNCIQPGFVEGERIDRVVEAKAKARGISAEAQRKELLSRVSLRTSVSAQDIANMALFLASDAGAHVSGQSLPVCGNVETLS